MKVLSVDSMRKLEQAAVAGGLAGIYYGVGGETGIPEEWIESLAKKEYIAELCEKAERRFTV